MTGPAQKLVRIVHRTQIDAAACILLNQVQRLLGRVPPPMVAADHVEIEIVQPVAHRVDDAILFGIAQKAREGVLAAFQNRLVGNLDLGRVTP